MVRKDTVCLAFGPNAHSPLPVVVSPASGPVRSPAPSLAAFAVRSLSGWGFGASVFTEPSPLPWTPSEYRSRSPFVVSGLLGAWVCMRSSGVCRGPSLFLFSVLEICLRREGGRRRRFSCVSVGCWQCLPLSGPPQDGRTFLALLGHRSSTSCGRQRRFSINLGFFLAPGCGSSLI